MPDGYRINTLVGVFNLCDTFGRYLPNILSPNKNTVIAEVFLRFIFVFSFPLLILVQRTYELVKKYFNIIRVFGLIL